MEEVKFIVEIEKLKRDYPQNRFIRAIYILKKKHILAMTILCYRLSQSTYTITQKEISTITNTQRNDSCGLRA